jgi:hypothetical protein
MAYTYRTGSYIRCNNFVGQSQYKQLDCLSSHYIYHNRCSITAIAREFAHAAIASNAAAFVAAVGSAQTCG